MVFVPYIAGHRKWMLILSFVLTVSALLFVYQINIPRFDILQNVGWSEAQSKSSLKSIPCYPAKNVVFLKTHKTASSSVQNIFLRYADEKNLTVAVPTNRNEQLFSLLQPFQKEMVTGVPWENLGFNILCHHMVFNSPAIHSVMPKDSIFISIVRDPVNLFESLYEYCELEDFYKMNIEEYARNTKNNSFKPKLQARSNGMGRNQMLYDFGVRPSYFSNPVKIQEAIEHLDSYFDFVMIAEHFDESIVILRHILCWELDDVISLTINARIDSYKNNLSDEAIKNLKEWNWGDKIVYDHYLHKFEETVNDIGKKQVEYEVEELRKRREEWMDYCVEKKVQARNLTAYKIWSNKVSGYEIKPNVKNQTCENLVKPESYYTAEIRQKQLVKSILKGAKVPNYGPKSLSRLIDLKYLKGRDREIARRLLENQYRHSRKRYSFLKEKTKT